MSPGAFPDPRGHAGERPGRAESKGREADESGRLRGGDEPVNASDDSPRSSPALEWARLAVVGTQRRALVAARRALLAASTDPAVAMVRRLLALRGIGEVSAWLYVMEFFSWRQFRNRREVGALAGLTPTAGLSGELRREQGISKAGSRHVRALAIELAWSWLRRQPASALSRWFTRRFSAGGGGCVGSASSHWPGGC